MLSVVYSSLIWQACLTTRTGRGYQWGSASLEIAHYFSFRMLGHPVCSVLAAGATSRSHATVTVLMHAIASCDMSSFPPALCHCELTNT